MTTEPVDWSALTRDFPANEIKQRPGPGGRTFSYVDARAVAVRLDEVLSPERWWFECNVIDGRDIVHGRLSIRVGSDWIVREDHGYPNSDRDEEPIKAATSDALKRCAVQFGIGRHLYDDNSSHVPVARASNRVAPSPRPVPPSPAGVDDIPFPGFEGPRPIDPRDEVKADVCPVHNKPWRANQRGYYCASKLPDGSWCDLKPSKAWMAERELEPAR